VGTDGKLIGFGTALIRWLGLVLSFSVLFLGVIWVAFDPQKQGWHDKIANTYVADMGSIGAGGSVPHSPALSVPRHGGL
jgi:uncharacterized RDD family membrane protein YckC